MGNDFLSSLRPSLVMAALFALLLGILYPLAITGIGQAVFPHQANGSIVTDAAGKSIGSALIGQGFARDTYFQPRPSAAGKGYDGMASSGSNFGPTSQALVDRVKGDISRVSVPGRPIPPDLVTASASGLDPDLSPEAALYQVDRVAKARGIAPRTLTALVNAQVDSPILPFLGDPHVNVLVLNQALDKAAPTK